MPAPAMTAKDVFDQALEIDSLVERKVFLDQACAEAPEIRQRVEALLLAYDEAGSQFLRRPDLPSELTGAYIPAPETPRHSGSEPHTVNDRPATVQPMPVESNSEHIGPYKLIKKVGEGGMGSVYLAQQEKPIRRQVALKIIKPGMNSGRVIARFDAERQALAMMEHEGIARVFDAGTTPAGQPYFVMEHIAGEPLNHYCRNHELTVRERLTLFVSICQAVQHAHQKGIMHRDLKSSNILVTLFEGKHLAKIIDFGLAKATEQQLTDHEDMTQVGNILGTWKYMSPEQSDIDGKGIDTRTDIYSLGVVLYELLTGSVAIDNSGQKGGFAEYQRRIKEEVPQKPSDRVVGLGEKLAMIAAERKTDPAILPKLLRGELDWITLKALEKDRDRRYQTARDFANDVQHYLNDEPVEACPPSRRYRLRKFVRRNRLVVAASTGFVVLLMLAVVGLSWGIYEANNSRIATKKKLSVEKRMREALAFNWAGIHALIRSGATLDYDQRTIFDHMLQGYRKVLGEVYELDDTLEMRETTAETENRIADLCQLLDMNEEAETSYHKAIEQYTKLSNQFSDQPKYRVELANCYFDLGHLLNNQSKPSDAEAAYRHSIELFKLLLVDFPNEPAYLRALADAYNNLGALMRNGNKLKEAENLFRDAIILGKKVLDSEPTNDRYKINLIAGYNNLGNVIRDLGDPNASQEWYGKTTAFLRNTKFSTDNARRTASEYLRNACWDRAHARGLLGLHAKATADWGGALDNNAGAMPEEECIRQFLATSEQEVKLQAEAKPTGSILFETSIQNARAAAAVDKLPAAKYPEEGRLKNQYTKRTLDLLKEAKTAGWFNDPQAIKRFQEEPDFKELLLTAEFKSFLASLSVGTKPKDQAEKK